MGTWELATGDLIEVVWVDACEATIDKDLKVQDVEVIQTSIGRYVKTVTVRGVDGVVIWNEKTETPTISYQEHFIPIALIISVTTY